MAYIALYRKYRSQSFDELMGQDQVTITLQNSIRSGRIAHAYLFYGARGCGKTSTARLLARALNCVAQDGPTAEPCGECRLCVGIRDGVCMDVIEMDAASETGIDDVREKIVENVQYAPGEARYKVYIIDEVHDLSAKAFDALLKTLEEPPPHVIFILATTEHHKVPITIRSRCMPYHFKRGTLQDLEQSVQRVINLEGCSAEPEAVQAIARSAEGSWRDALSLLEQVMAYADGNVTAELVHRALGSVGTETLARVTETLAAGDWCATLAIAGELVDSGKDVRQLLAALSGHLRDLMLIAAGAHNAARQELGAERYELLKTQAPLFSPAVLLTMTAILSTAEREVRFTNQHRWLLESTLLRMMPANLSPSAEAGRQTAAIEPGVPAPAPHPRRETVASTPTVLPRPRPAETASQYPVDGETDSTEPPPPRQRDHGAGSPAETARPAANGPEKESAAPSRFAEPISLDVVRRSWPRVIALFRKASPSGAPWLEKGEVVELDGHTIVLAFGDSFARERIQNNAKGKAKVEQVVNQGLNTDGYKIRCIGREGEPAVEQAVTPAPPDQPSNLLDGADDASVSDPPSPVSDKPLDTASSGEEPGCEPTNSALPALSDRPSDSTEQAVVAAIDVRAVVVEATADVGLLAETLSVFGGSVVRTEPLNRS